MKKIIIIRSPNETVTDNNFKILENAAKETGLHIVVCNSFKEAIKKSGRTDLCITSNNSDVLSLTIRRRTNILFWVQGIVPEESLMRHGNKVRFIILSLLEKYALLHSRYLAFVSEPMKEHFETKYGLHFDGKYYIFPCFNTELNISAFDNPNKYKNNYFVYAGGLAVWQCFEKTLDIYKKVEAWGLPCTKLIVLTRDQKKATEMIEARNIQNFNTGYTTPDKLPDILKDAKFGFVIREASPVNSVATPTKISTYLSCGLIPIFGESVEAFRRFSEKMKYTVCWDDSKAAYDKLLYFMTTDINAQQVFKEYASFFENNYSRERHTKALCSIIKQLVEE